MMLALPAIWLYSCTLHETGTPSVTWMLGWPPPVHVAAIQVPNALLMICSVSANVMPSLGEPSCWTEYSTHDCGQAMGSPQSAGMGGMLWGVHWEPLNGIIESGS